MILFIRSSHFLLVMYIAKSSSMPVFREFDTVFELYKFLHDLKRNERRIALIRIISPLGRTNYHGYTIEYPQIYYPEVISRGLCYRGLSLTPFYDDPDITFEQFYDTYANHPAKIDRPYVNAAYFKYHLDPDAYIGTIDFPRNEDLYIKAPMGCGKTTAIVNALKSKSAETTILVISPRRTITATICQKFLEARVDINNYMTSVDINADSERIVISPNSLTKLSIFREYDYILIDEIMLLLEYIFSKHPRRRKKMLLILERLILTCKHLICSDAYLFPRVIDILTAHRHTDARFLEYERADNKIYTFIDSSTFEDEITRDVIYNRKSYIFCETKRIAKRVFTKIESLLIGHPDRVILITADTSNKLSILRDPNKTFIKYDYVVASPVILSGLDFTAEHFDKVYGLYNETVLSAMSLIQMSGRIRKAGQCWFVNMRKIKKKPSPSVAYKFDPIEYADLSTAINLKFDDDMRVVVDRTVLFELYEFITQYMWLTKGTLRNQLEPIEKID